MQSIYRSFQICSLIDIVIDTQNSINASFSCRYRNITRVASDVTRIKCRTSVYKLFMLMVHQIDREEERERGRGGERERERERGAVDSSPSVSRNCFYANAITGL